MEKRYVTKKPKEWTAIKIEKTTHAKLQKMAKRRGETLTQLIELLLNRE